MRHNRKLVAFGLLSIIALSGQSCEDTRPPNSYSGAVTVRKTNGGVTAVVIELPTNAATVTTRKDAVALIAQLESLLTDLKGATDQFPVNEKLPVPTVPEQQQAPETPVPPSN